MFSYQPRFVLWNGVACALSWSPATFVAVHSPGAYTLSASANGLPLAFSPTLNVTASSLAVAITPRRTFVNQNILISIAALDVTGCCPRRGIGVSKRDVASAEGACLLGDQIGTRVRRERDNLDAVAVRGGDLQCLAPDGARRAEDGYAKRRGHLTPPHHRTQ